MNNGESSISAIKESGKKNIINGALTFQNTINIGNFINEINNKQILQQNS